MVYLLLFIEGVLAFISPCILPMVPVYLLYLGGDSRTGDRPLRRRFLNTLAFIMGFTLIFVALGAAASGLGAFLQAHMNELRLVSGLVMLFVGIYYLDIIHLPASLREKLPRRAGAQRGQGPAPGGGGAARSFVFGLAFSSTWLPCVGTFLASAISLAANRSTLSEGMGMLFVFSMGLGLPFLLASLLFEQLRGSFNFLKRHARAVRLISGLLLILLALSMLFNVQSLYMGLFV